MVNNNPFTGFLNNTLQGVSNGWDTMSNSLADINWLGGDKYGQIGVDTAGNPVKGVMQTQGALSPLIQGLSAGTQAWLGMQQLDLAKDQLAFQKDTWAKNYSNQANLTNQELLRRQALRQQVAGQSGNVSDSWKMSNLLPTK